MNYAYNIKPLTILLESGSNTLLYTCFAFKYNVEQSPHMFLQKVVMPSRKIEIKLIKMPLAMSRKYENQVISSSLQRVYCYSYTSNELFAKV